MIQGMTTSSPRPTQIAILRKGAPKPEHGPGKDLNHFRLDPIDPADTELVAAFEAEYGPEPNYIMAYLPFASASENFEAWREAWTASQLHHRCDGVHVYERNERGELVATSRLCPGGCKQVGRLALVVLALVTRAGRFGITTAQTTSIHDIVNLSRALAYYETLAKGDLRGIPFVLSRRPVEISTPSGTNGRARRAKWLLFIEPAREWVTQQLEAARRVALSAPRQRLLVDAAGVVVEDEGDEPLPDEGDLDSAIARYNVLARRATQELGMEVVALRRSDSYADVIAQENALAGVIRDSAFILAGDDAILPASAAPIEEWIDAAADMLAANREAAAIEAEGQLELAGLPAALPMED